MTMINPNLHGTPDNASEETTNNVQFIRLKLTNQQQALYKALFEKEQRLALIYLGALKILKDTDNPERLVFAAHGLRELMEKIPAIVDVQIKAHKEGLKIKIVELEDFWQYTLKKSKCYNNDTWSGQIDSHLLELLEKMQKFFNWFDEHHPRRRKEITETLRRIDNSRLILPEPLEKLNFKSWDEIRSFFSAVAHHGKSPTEDDFNKWLNALELFLLDRLRPRTFVDFDKIDAIIQEGENKCLIKKQ